MGFPGDVRSNKNPVVSSLDCLSSIVERISTESPAASSLPAAELCDGVTGSQPETSVPSPNNTCSPSGPTQDPIYQVL